MTRLKYTGSRYPSVKRQSYVTDYEYIQTDNESGKDRCGLVILHSALRYPSFNCDG